MTASSGATLVGQTVLPAELCVVDSSEEALRRGEIERLCAEAGIRLDYVHPAPRGLTLQRNIGIDRTSGDPVFLIDDDVTFAPDVHEEVLAEYDSASEVAIAAAHENGLISLTLRPSDGTVGESDLTGGPIWRFLTTELSELKVDITDGAHRLTFYLAPSPATAFATAALTAYQQSTDVEAAESEGLAHILHDLKNHLISFHSVLGGRESDRTSRLAAQLDALRNG